MLDRVYNESFVAQLVPRCGWLKQAEFFNHLITFSLKIQLIHMRLAGIYLWCQFLGGKTKMTNSRSASAEG